MLQNTGWFEKSSLLHYIIFQACVSLHAFSSDIKHFLTSLFGAVFINNYAYLEMKKT